MVTICIEVDVWGQIMDQARFFNITLTKFLKVKILLSGLDGHGLLLDRVFNNRPCPLNLDNKVLHNAGRDSLSQFLKVNFKIFFPLKSNTT